jgi:N-carbamoylputrescine amidase
MAWQTVQRGHAVANGLPVVTVNRVGVETLPQPLQGGEKDAPQGGLEGVPFWGTSFVAGPQGELLYEAPTDQEVEVVVEVDMQRSEQVRRWWPFLRDRRIEAYNDITKRFIDER